MTNVSICHLIWDGVKMTHTPDSTVLMVDDNRLPWRPWNAPRGSWATPVIQKEIDSAMKTVFPAPITGRVVLLNCERMDDWTAAADPIGRICEALVGPDIEASAVYLYGHHGDHVSLAIDGRLIPMNRPGSEEAPGGTEGARIPILHPNDYSEDHIRRRIDKLASMGWRSITLWACSSPTTERSTTAKLDRLTGYFAGVCRFIDGDTLGPVCPDTIITKEPA